MKVLIWIIAVLLTLSTGLGSGSGSTEEEEHERRPSATTRRVKTVSRPPFKELRYEEDWSVLESVSTLDGADRIKYLPLNSSGDAYLSLGGQLRLRGESWSGFAFGETDRFDDSFGLLRARLHADLWISSGVRFFAEAKSALATDRDLPGGLRTLDVDNIDFLNGFVELIPYPDREGFRFIGGRQELLFGKQRLISPFDWANTRRTFDAVRGILERGGWRFDGFWSRPVTIRKYSLNSSSISDADFYGIYSSGPISSSVNLDLYWLGLEKERSAFGGITAPECRQTFGFRTAGKFGAQNDFDIEMAYQTGEHGDRDIGAFMFASEFGRKLEGTPLAPRIHLGFGYASGDDDPSDDALSTFNQLFPLGHAYLGYIDLVGRQNIIDVTPGVHFSPLPKLGLAGNLHFFWRAEEDDALYNAGGGVVRLPGAGSSREVGSELDLTASYSVNRHTNLNGGYCHFFPGDFIEETGSSGGVDFLYLALQFTF